jgi:hypothetical protein
MLAFQTEEKLVAYLQSSQKRGTVKANLDPFPAVDMFTGMLLAGMLCRSAKFNQGSYSCDDYIETCVDIFVCGISATLL